MKKRPAKKPPAATARPPRPKGAQKRTLYLLDSPADPFTQIKAGRKPK